MNYSGSSGFGRAYIERLAKLWGIADNDDCISSAQAISSRPLDYVDPKRICIRGASSGGFAVLAVLSYGRFRSTFAAGTSIAGISDLGLLAQQTHKFELHYMEKLLGGTYADIPWIYERRSPLTHAKDIGVPLLVCFLHCGSVALIH